ncbi:50S ribosomal protein L32 [Hathewaya massiliensis]|uniref:50S ribosomal protein L32 n=1 Tax=Hathewaya massiliensis TaxID=1964382 RepID=UPI001157BEE0|nr:50S ribosomal protein L32 [Hathewaya massiliensis]
MAHPKRKTSKARRDQRRAQNFKLSMPGIVECPQCHEFKLAHRVCKSCGYYKNTKVVSDDK